MKNIFFSLVVILIIPVISLIAAKGIQYKINNQWYNLVEKEFGEMPDDRIDAISLKSICADPEKAANIKECSTYNNLNLIIKSAQFCALLGICFLFMIALAGYISRTKRCLLLIIFKPGLYLTLIVVAILTIFNAVLTMAVIYYADAVLAGRVHFSIILGIGLAELLGIVAMVISSFNIVKTATITVIGYRLIENKYLTIWQFVKDVSKEVNIEPPHNIIVGLDPNFCVSQAIIRCLDGELKGRTLYISLPLCRILSVSEFKAIICHELGHYRGSDTQFSEKFFPIYRGTLNSLEVLSLHAHGGNIKSSALLPAYYILAYFLWSFSAAEKNVSRERELVADQIAANIVGEKIVATSIIKVVAFMEFWKFITKYMIEALSNNKYFINVSSLFEELVIEYSIPEALKGIEDKTLPHPIDSHPPLRLRLKALNQSITEVSSEALQTHINSAAINLISNYEELEKKLSEIEQHILVESGKVTIDNL